MIAALLLFALLTEEPVLVPAGHHAYRVSSGSMEPTLLEGDVVLADRPGGVCGTTWPVQGDIVVARTRGQPWLRRVVAGSGQTVQVMGGVLHVDGQPVKRERVDPAAMSEDQSKQLYPQVSVWRETLPSGRSWLISDFGDGQMLDDTPEVLVPEGHWFALGDSRDNAVDDRVHGPTAASDLCGVVVSVVRSDDPSRIGTRP